MSKLHHVAIATTEFERDKKIFEQLGMTVERENGQISTRQLWFYEGIQLKEVEGIQFLVGDITSVCGMTKVIHKKRKDFKKNIIEVENDDIAQFICEYKNGAMGYISSNRVAPGSKQDMKFEIHLTKGAIKFSLERMNEIMIYKVGDNGYSIVISDENGWFCKGYEKLIIEIHLYKIMKLKNFLKTKN